MRGRALHLASRFFAGLRPAPVSDDDRAWAHARLTGPEQQLWDRYAARDQAHTLAVAQAVDHWVAAHPEESAEVESQAPGALVSAALLHDIGKIEAPLGLMGRVVATLVEAVAGAKIARFGDRTNAVGTIARYCDYPERGAGLLTDAGSNPVVVAWAGEHHEPEASWSLPVPLGRMLARADDGRLGVS